MPKYACEDTHIFITFMYMFVYFSSCKVAIRFFFYSFQNLDGPMELCYGRLSHWVSLYSLQFQDVRVNGINELLQLLLIVNAGLILTQTSFCCMAERISKLWGNMEYLLKNILTVNKTHFVFHFQIHIVITFIFKSFLHMYLVRK